MIRVTIELLPGGDGSKIENIGVVEIINDGTGGIQTGNYDVRMMKSPRYSRTPGVWKKGRVEGFAREILGPYDLLYRALAAVLARRNPRCPAPDLVEGGGR